MSDNYDASGEVNDTENIIDLVNQELDLQAQFEAITTHLHAHLPKALQEPEPTHTTTILVVGYSDQHQRETIIQACKGKAQVYILHHHQINEPTEDWIIGTAWMPSEWWHKAIMNLDPTAMIYTPGTTQDIIDQILKLTD